jgi:hypothetical protein
MKRFLSGGLAMLGLVMLSSFAVVASRSEPKAAAVQAVTPLKLSDLTLDRAFRETVNMLALGGTLTLGAPSSAGWVITTLSTNTNPVVGFQVTISKNGAPPQQVTTGWHVVTPGAVAHVIPLPQTITLDPPLVVRPGETVSLSCQDWLTIGGYVVYPGEV